MNNIPTQEEFESGMLYVTAIQDAVLQLDSNNNLYSTVPELDQLIQDYDIIDFKIAFPLSQVLTNAYQMQCNCDENDLLQAVSAIPQYYTIPEKVPIPQLLYTPDDYTLTYNPDWALDLIQAEEAWDITTGDPSIVLGITDADFDINHQELIGTYNFVFAANNISGNSVNHGTAVAITAAGNTDNGIGKSSIGFDCKMTLHDMGYNAVLEAANQGVKVINMSWLGSCTFSSYAQGIMDEVHDIYGVVLVAAAGNGDVPNTCSTDPSILVYPAAYDNVISVSSIGVNDNHENPPGNPATHQHNSEVDLVAPGYSVPLIGAGSVVGTSSGSSFAAPHVSGTAGLILSINPSFTPDEVEQILKCTADDIYGLNPTYVGLLGAGRLNANEAVKMASNFTSPQLDVVSACSSNEGSASITLLGNGTYDYLWSTGETGDNISGLSEGNYSVTVTHQCGFSKTFDFTIDAVVSASDFDYPNGLVITSTGQQIQDLVPDGVIKIRGALEFTDDVNYNFGNMTIEFGRDLLPPSPDQGHTHSGVIVESGSKVSASNVTFRGITDCDAMWDGIQIWGDDFTSPPVATPGKKMLFPNVNSLKNGALNMTGCTVRDAHIGVATYRVNMPFIMNPPEYGRGVLNAKFTHFLNNNVGVDFSTRNNVANNSTIRECTFTSNEPLINEIQYGGRGIDVFIRLLGVSNPYIAGNTFNGHLGFVPGERGAGIRSYGAGYRVQSGNAGPTNPNTPPVPNTFNNLDQGIDIYSKGGSLKTVRIRDNRFNNVYQGVTASGSNFDEISFNIFNTPMGEVSLNSWAMFLNTSSGFLVTENTMNTLGTNDVTFGIVTKDVDVVMSEVYKNNFNGDYQAATQVQGTSNDEIQIDCNKYQGTNEYDWRVFSGTLADQGFCGPNFTDQVKNLFDNCSTADESQIYSPLTTFVYSTEQPFMPNCTSGTVTEDLCITTSSYEDACPQLVTNPCPSCIVALGQQVDFLPPGLARKKVKGQYVRALAQEGNVQGLIDFLVNEGETKDRKVLIPTHLDRKEYIDARNELNLLDQTTSEDQKFYELFDLLTFIGEDGRELDSITLTERQIVEAIANTATPVSIQAQAILAELDRGVYLRFPEQVAPEASGIMLNSHNQSETLIEKSTNVTVYPNPSKGDIVIEFEEASQSTGELLDAMGREVRSFETHKSQRTYELNSLSHGVYMLVIHYLDGEIETKRILVE